MKKDVKSITSQLWDMANKLRGTMNASDYKDYILPFLFYRYLSERQEAHLIELGIPEYLDMIDAEDEDFELYTLELLDTLGFAINPKYTWANLINVINNKTITASFLPDLFDAFDKNIKKHPRSEEEFRDVFEDINLNNSRLGTNTNEKSAALYEIIEIINEVQFKDDSGRDLLGDIYEYLIGKFAADAGQSGGEFYTPHEVSKILAKIVTLDASDKGEFRVYDPTMGSGSLLLTVEKELPFKAKKGTVTFYGQELNTTTYNLARMNLMMHNVSYKNMKLRRGDTLENDWPTVEEDGVETPTLFDAVVANPPYSLKWKSNLDKDPRFKAGLAPKSRADYAFVQHSLYHLDRKGTMAVVLPHGVLFRGGAEAKIRKELLLDNRLDAVIGLPANLFYGTSIPTCVMIFKGLDAKVGRDVLFIDASEEFEKNKNKNTLSEDHINKIVDTYVNREFVDKYAYVASIEEIEENDFNLNIPRYVDTFVEEEVIPLDELVSDLNKVDQDIRDSKNGLKSMVDDLVTEDVAEDLEKFIDWLNS